MMPVVDKPKHQHLISKRLSMVKDRIQTQTLKCSRMTHKESAIGGCGARSVARSVECWLMDTLLYGLPCGLLTPPTNVSPLVLTYCLCAIRAVPRHLGITGSLLVLTSCVVNSICIYSAHCSYQCSSYSAPINNIRLLSVYCKGNHIHLKSFKNFQQYYRDTFVILWCIVLRHMYHDEYHIVE